MTKSLSKAIALATALGAAASAHAVNVNQDGLGEVLLYSLYTVEEGNTTNVSITNTTGEAKAVKVRFVEGQNSREVLDFNLYLSAYDQWSGAVVRTDDGARLVTADKSCTLPEIKKEGVEFRDFAYVGDGGEQSLARTRVGHIEMIEMGVLDAATAALVTADHNVAGSAPAGCDALRSRFTKKDGIWNSSNPSKNLVAGFLESTEAEGKTGGLYGSATVLNIEGSTQIAYDAVAIDNFMTDYANGPKPIHTFTGSLSPSLVEGGNSIATFKNGSQLEFDESASAISALLMKQEISNDFVLDEGRNSKTNWVVTFPTKRFHVNVDFLKDAAGNEILDPTGQPIPAYDTGLSPFVNPWNAGQSCHAISISKWDNEEYSPKEVEGDSDIDFSPMPPVIPGVVTVPNLCYETNVLTFNQGKVLGGDLVTYDMTLAQPEYRFGWMKIGFAGMETAPGTYEAYELEGFNLDTNQDEVVAGLPVIGFSAVTISNGKAANGAMNNYGSSTSHKASTSRDH